MFFFLFLLLLLQKVLKDDKERKEEKTHLRLSSFFFLLSSLPCTRGFWLLTPFQIILFVGIPIAYTITAAISFQKIVALVEPASSWAGADGGGLGRWIVIFMLINLCVVQVRSFHSLSVVSMVGTVASVFYALVAFIGSLARGRGGGGAGEVSYDFGAVKSHGSSEALVFNAANAIATIAFAYGGKNELEREREREREERDQVLNSRFFFSLSHAASKTSSIFSAASSKQKQRLALSQFSGHNIAQEIQATLPFPPSTTKPMMNSVHATFAFTAFFYFSVAFTGYFVFGNAVEANILISLSKPLGVILAGERGKEEEWRKREKERKRERERFFCRFF